jgi:hypothetical protein
LRREETEGKDGREVRDGKELRGKSGMAAWLRGCLVDTRFWWAGR